MTDDSSPDWGAVERTCATTPLPALLDELDVLLAPVVGNLELWLWDQQYRTLRALRAAHDIDNARSPDANWPATAVLRAELRFHEDTLGVVTASSTGPSPTDRRSASGAIDRLAPLLAAVVRSSESTVDTIEIRRRRQEMGLAAELQAALLPPPGFAVEGATVSAAVEPAYEAGGDIYDYALHRDALRVAVLDAMGHGLDSSLLSTLAVGAMRRARRAGADLEHVAADMLEGLSRSDQTHGFVTALLMDFDLRTWRGRWLTAGHPPPLVFDGRSFVEPPWTPALPIGLNINGRVSRPRLAPIELAPGHTMVLYSDGIVENADTGTGAPVGDDRFREILGRHLAARPPVRPDTHLARRVVDDLLTLTGTSIRDDATLLLLMRDR